MSTESEPAAARLAPPDPPELPPGVSRRPRWPWWYAFAGFGAGVAGTVVIGAIFVLAALALGAEEEDPGVTIGATLIQFVSFVGAALGLAYLSGRPRAWHFGLRRTRLWPAVGLTVLGFVVFFAVLVGYGALVRPPEQTVLDDLGADEGTAALIAAGVMAIVVAPVAEEIFFRGFLYSALRSSFPIWAAVLIAGGIFGALHFFTGPLSVPPLILFGAILCLLYEVTGSLYPSIALHAFNNMIAYLAGTEAIALSLSLGAAVIAACFLAPRFAWRSAPAGR